MATGNTRTYARHRGVSQAAVSKAIKNGRLEKSVTRDGRSVVIDFELADQEWRENTGPRRWRPENDTPDLPPNSASVITDELSYNEARRLNEVRKLELADLEVAKKRGSLIDADQAAKMTFEILRVVRDRLFALPPHLANTVLAAQDEPSAILAIKREMQQVFTEASQAVESQFAGR